MKYSLILSSKLLGSKSPPLIAYFKHEEKPKLYIKGFFDCSEFSNELDLNFSMATCEKLIFLNEEEIYIEYIDNNSETIKKVVNFKN